MPLPASMNLGALSALNVGALGAEARHHAIAMLAVGVVRFTGSDEPEDLSCGLGMLTLCESFPADAVQWLLDLEAQHHENGSPG